jgi:transcriptional regulator with XRE-family HTH domain
MLIGIHTQVKQIFMMAKPIKLRADLSAIGLRIKELRGEMFQEELAAHLGISQGQLSKIERGKLGPTAEILVRLIQLFGKSADWILTGS